MTKEKRLKYAGKTDFQTNSAYAKKLHGVRNFSENSSSACVKHNKL
jgi:hypothetical protein